MWKIIKKSSENILLNKKKFTLWMKWEFNIEFASDSFWPYKYKFERKDCYFIDWLGDRWTVLFPLKNKNINNTEIFIESDDLVIATWDRWSLSWKSKTFIDIINIKTEKKYRLFTDEVNLIYNSNDSIVINANDINSSDKWFKTLVLDINTLEKKDEINEKLLAFFKSVYNITEDKWYLLDFYVWNENEINEEKKYQNGYFNLKKSELSWTPTNFDRKSFKVKTLKGSIDIWDESIK